MIRLYMSLFSVSNLIPLAPRVRRSLFLSISDPSNLESISAVASEMRPRLGSLLRRYVPAIDRIPLKQGMRFIPTWKSVPSCAWYRKLLKRCGTSSQKPFKVFSRKTSIFHCLFSELAAFQFLMNLNHSRQDQFSQGCLWPEYTRYAFDRQTNKYITNWSLEWFERRIGPLLPSTTDLGIPPNTGRLCQACTGNGKRVCYR